MESLDYNQNLIIRVTEYGMKNSNFKLSKLKIDLNLSDSEFDFVENALTEKSRPFTDNPNHLLVPSDFKKSEFSNQLLSTHNKYSLVPNAFYNYIDLLEIREARKQANIAKKQSMIAIWISVLAIIISVTVEIVLFKLKA
jgi:hypothetical protein